MLQLILKQSLGCKKVSYKLTSWLSGIYKLSVHLFQDDTIWPIINLILRSSTVSENWQWSCLIMSVKGLLYEHTNSTN